MKIVRRTLLSLALTGSLGSIGLCGDQCCREFAVQNTVNGFGQTPLAQIVEHADLKSEEKLLKLKEQLTKGADPNCLCHKGIFAKAVARLSKARAEDQRLLHQVVKKVSDDFAPDFIEALIDAGMKPDTRKDQEKTPLSLAVKHLKVKTVAVLLNKGADAMLVDEGHFTHHRHDIFFEDDQALLEHCRRMKPIAKLLQEKLESEPESEDKEYALSLFKKAQEECEAIIAEQEQKQKDEL